MTDTPRLWMRHEVRLSERRAPIVPADAALLVEQGVAVTVEDSPQRVFPISDYAAAGRCLRAFHTACHRAGLDSTGERTALA